MEKEEGMELQAQGFMLIKTHLICSSHALRCLSLKYSEYSIAYSTYSIYLYLYGALNWSHPSSVSLPARWMTYSLSYPSYNDNNGEPE